MMTECCLNYFFNSALKVIYFLFLTISHFFVSDFRISIFCLGGHLFLCDLQLQDLLVFSAITDFHNHFLYKAGHIILQEIIEHYTRPTYSLQNMTWVEPHFILLHWSWCQTSVHYEHSSPWPGVTCHQLANQDFLKVDPQSSVYKEVKYILLDPSCSGSG